jgi:hypothetical protein
MVGIAFRRRSLTRILIILGLAFFARYVFFPSSSSASPSSFGSSHSHEIQGHNFLEKATRADKTLNVQKHPFLQARMGRDERPELMGNVVQNGMRDYWERFQLP